MPSLKDLRNRIASVTATRKITKAMQMVAAAKLRRAQTAADAARPYAERMSEVLGNLSAGVAGQAGAPPLMVGTGKDDVYLLVVCTAERGLCGGFNSSIAKKARDEVNRLTRDGKTVKILCVGRKGHDILKRLFKNQIIDFVDFRSVRHLGFSEAELVAEKVLALFAAGEFDVCTLFFSEFKSVVSQVPTTQRLIPADFEVEEGAAPKSYEYEPDETEILDDLLPRNVAVQIFRALLENAAGEQGARMSAMDSATRNAGEMIDKLTLSYNRQRQAQITKELIEIISGAEAL
ncbi:MAG: F0F1 ATP synthase subunit gamma [Rhodobiaceae bacterium]|nr:F0F1 ATP synthase subunit gamma [Rhizobiaceae bacterium]MCB1480529.1 F0F1 ATP synthase subunit gamma [Rhodobiaceae bacterium]MCC0012420.1 F0F1 ATP synthase subunit gamma [Rhodobiaceae bacterium]MCC0019294.1 F0F1 ATP synthase subunit gamma [Rhodobiaceae bacterium]